MIRDPSDGSVREKPSKEINIPANEINAIPAKTSSEGITACMCEACQRDGFQHQSVCPVHNGPALPIGICDCKDCLMVGDISPIDSGLQTGSSRPGEIERLNKSREWLKQFKQEKAK